MKKLILPLLLLCFFVSGYSQTDTLYTKKQDKISCKIIEINEFDIKYKLAASIDGPMYVINKTTVTKYTLSNGFTELLLPDELSLENEHGEIIKNRTVIKVHPFSVVNNQLSFAYEQVLKVGTNLDIEAGYVNTGLNSSTSSNRIYNSGRTNYSGAYVKPGVKFFLGQDFSVKGLRYAHPLKGRYIKLDIGLSYLNFQNVERIEYSGGNYPTPVQHRTVSTDINTFAYGGFVNFGRQFILGNVLTIEYYFGVGFTGRTIDYTNDEFVRGNNGYYYNENTSISNYHGFQRIPNFGLSGTAGFRIGYIIPEKKAHKDPSAQKNK
ncbi:MAG: hypothetical protein V4635_05875 [Bacteroidota bacterium]